MEDETIGSCSDFGPKYEFCPDSEWWKEGISYSEMTDRRGTPPLLSQSPLEKEFNERADRWERETAIHSSPAAKFLHKDYQFIMAKGERVIPFILKRLETSKKDWFWALRHIAGEEENPAKDAKDFDEAVRAWREWARSNHYIS